MKFLKCTYVALLTLFLSPMVANAIPITWNLDNAFFDDGTELIGSFDYDATIDVYSGWNMTVVDGTMSAYNYQPGIDGGFLGVHNPMVADFVAFPPLIPGRFIRLSFANALTDAGGLESLNVTAESFECDNCTIRRNIVSGEVSANSVPEPAILTLFGVALFGFGLMKPRRKI